MQAVHTYRSYDLTPARVGALPSIACALLIIDLLLIAIYVALYLPGYQAGVLALNHERTIPNWYASAKLLVLAQLLVFIAWAEPMPTRRTRWVLLAPALFFLLVSLDEVAGIHERFERRLAPQTGVGGDDTVDLSLWMSLAGLLFAGALITALVAYARNVRLASPTKAKAGAGAAIFLTGVVGVDNLAHLVDGHVVDVLGVAAEEGCELIGITLLIWAALDLVAPRVQRSRHQPEARA